MKLVFSTLDLIAVVGELRKELIGLRVNNVYDINNKTYLLKFSSGDQKSVLLIESGARIHLTEFDWMKNPMPSGFSMKLRKHIRNKKCVQITQLGLDRIVVLQFGFEEGAYHLIVELYDRGNMFLTDGAYTILHLLRPRTDANQDVRYAAHEKYPVELARPVPDGLKNLKDVSSVDRISSLIHSHIRDTKGPWTLDRQVDNSVRPVQKVLASEFPFGQATVEHCCRKAQQGIRSELATFKANLQKETHTPNDTELEGLLKKYADHWAFALRELLLHAKNRSDVGADEGRGYIFGKKSSNEDEELLSQDEFHPFLFEQYQTKAYVSYPTFNKAVDAFFSRIESQKTTEKLAQNEVKANKKLENIKRDHELRLSALKADQELDVQKAQLLESNRVLVDNILLMINHALSNQLDWGELEMRLTEAKARGDPLASHVTQLNLQCNQITIRLSNPFDDMSDSAKSDEDNEVAAEQNGSQPSGVDVVVDLDLNALNNARKYYDKKRAAVKKEEKTLIASRKALKSAAFKAEQTRKDVKTLVQISKVRKPMWFEKFFWFISSENYLVVAGRDALQNEALVKRYLGPDDIYVHADLHGASSVVIKARPLLPEELLPSLASTESSGPESTSSSSMPIPPAKTLNEAGTMAIVLSSAWSARVVTSAWWVRADQVSKTAPSGEYLTTGAFMIRGRKNYLPMCHFFYGFGILFKLDEDSVPQHRAERRIARPDAVDPNANLVETEDTEVAIISDDDDRDAETSFPDAQLRLDLIKTAEKTSKPTRDTKQTAKRDDPTDNGKPTAHRKRQQANQIPDTQTKQGTKPQTQSNASSGGQKTGPLKRGQKSKLKKIKQKYGEQDEDERHIRMALLQGEGAKLSQHHQRLLSDRQKSSTVHDEDQNEKPEEEPPLQANDSQSDSEAAGHGDTDPAGSPVPELKQGERLSEQAAVQSDEDNDDNDQFQSAESKPAEDNWLHLMDTFTGKPLEDDVLLYALPVCAPYSALSNYKFKVKLTPGTAKRGKAAKTALQCFLTDKTATVREKELIRVMKSEDVSRNFPGSVKVSLPQGKPLRIK